MMDVSRETLKLDYTCYRDNAFDVMGSTAI